ncbi:hypothetical protein CEXT_262001 [Caerostris extrusa]|uniref:Uncharacterized protein n=1 Tax=Caerostris extrusa TaxID=172846 RepID=A0AAV4XQL6_CAEEX|nr:hypothetical protein CEXT_262001 [Caerostris extrusa]
MKNDIRETIVFKSISEKAEIAFKASSLAQANQFVLFVHQNCRLIIHSVSVPQRIFLSDVSDMLNNSPAVSGDKAETAFKAISPAKRGNSYFSSIKTGDLLLIRKLRQPLKSNQSLHKHEPIRPFRPSKLETYYSFGECSAIFLLSDVSDMLNNSLAVSGDVSVSSPKSWDSDTVVE